MIAGGFLEVNNLDIRKYIAMWLMEFLSIEKISLPCNGLVCLKDLIIALNTHSAVQYFMKQGYFEHPCKYRLDEQKYADSCT